MQCARRSSASIQVIEGLLLFSWAPWWLLTLARFEVAQNSRISVSGYEDK